ncbi:MAG TPA: MerR family transcriptional regulator [Clostridia bacterium]|nr:MerR family transcriptional regulator [Clostridia bacterium]
MSTAKKRRVKSQADEITVPDKLYFRIGEVAKLSRLPAYVLRFWETEFPQLKPSKGSTGQRMYRRRDVENVLVIKKLLYEEGYTIAGAREKLKADVRITRSQPVLPFPKKAPAESLKRVRHGLKEILEILTTRR